MDHGLLRRGSISRFRFNLTMPASAPKIPESVRSAARAFSCHKPSPPQGAVSASATTANNHSNDSHACTTHSLSSASRSFPNLARFVPRDRRPSEASYRSAVSSRSSHNSVTAAPTPTTNTTTTTSTTPSSTCTNGAIACTTTTCTSTTHNASAVAGRPPKPRRPLLPTPRTPSMDLMRRRRPALPSFANRPRRRTGTQRGSSNGSNASNASNGSNASSGDRISDALPPSPQMSSSSIPSTTPSSSQPISSSPSRSAPPISTSPSLSHPHPLPSQPFSQQSHSPSPHSQLTPSLPVPNSPPAPDLLEDFDSLVHSDVQMSQGKRGARTRRNSSGHSSRSKRSSATGSGQGPLARAAAVSGSLLGPRYSSDAISPWPRLPRTRARRKRHSHSCDSIPSPISATSQYESVPNDNVLVEIGTRLPDRPLHEAQRDVFGRRRGDFVVNGQSLTRSTQRPTLACYEEYDHVVVDDEEDEVDDEDEDDDDDIIDDVIDDDDDDYEDDDDDDDNDGDKSYNGKRPANGCVTMATSNHEIENNDIFGRHVTGQKVNPGATRVGREGPKLSSAMKTSVVSNGSTIYGSQHSETLEYSTVEYDSVDDLSNLGTIEGEWEKGVREEDSDDGSNISDDGISDVIDDDDDDDDDIDVDIDVDDVNDDDDDDYYYDDEDEDDDDDDDNEVSHVEEIFDGDEEETLRNIAKAIDSSKGRLRNSVNMNKAFQAVIRSGDGLIRRSDLIQATLNSSDSKDASMIILLEPNSYGNGSNGVSSGETNGRRMNIRDENTRDVNGNDDDTDVNNDNRISNDSNNRKCHSRDKNKHKNKCAKRNKSGDTSGGILGAVKDMRRTNDTSAPSSSCTRRKDEGSVGFSTSMTAKQCAATLETLLREMECKVCRYGEEVDDGRFVIRLRTSRAIGQTGAQLDGRKARDRKVRIIVIVREEDDIRTSVSFKRLGGFHASRDSHIPLCLEIRERFQREWPAVVEALYIRLPTGSATTGAAVSTNTV